MRLGVWVAAACCCYYCCWWGTDHVPLLVTALTVISVTQPAKGLLLSLTSYLSLTSLLYFPLTLPRAFWSALLCSDRILLISLRLSVFAAFVVDAYVIWICRCGSHALLLSN